jgi:hypothetical protein
MNDSTITDLQIQISSMDGSDEDLDRLTRQLLSELMQADVESAHLVQGAAAPAGAKGDPVALGSIAVQLLPAVLPGIIGLVQAWVDRGPGRKVKFKSGAMEFEGSPEDLHKLLVELDKRKKKR